MYLEIILEQGCDQGMSKWSFSVKAAISEKLIAGFVIFCLKTFEMK